MERGEVGWSSEGNGRLSVARLAERGFPRLESRREDVVGRSKKREGGFEVALDRETT